MEQDLKDEVQEKEYMNEEMKETDPLKEEEMQSQEADSTDFSPEQNAASEGEASEDSVPATDSEADKKKSSGNKSSGSKSSSSKKSRKTVKGLEMELKAQGEIIDELSKKLNAAEQAAEQTQDKYQRLMAEFENMRKRTEKEAAHMYDVGAKEVLEKLLPVIDNFERAQMTVTEEQREDPFVQGVDKIYRQTLDYLDSVKVTAMNAEGKEFDPDLHNAVMHIDDDAYDDNVVVEELQKGYMYKDEVLRHSMVKVAN